MNDPTMQAGATQHRSQGQAPARTRAAAARQTQSRMGRCGRGGRDFQDGSSVEIPPHDVSFMPSVGAPTDAAAAMALLQDHWDEASAEGRREAGYLAAVVFGWELAGVSHETRIGRPPGM